MFRKFGASRFAGLLTRVSTAGLVSLMALSACDGNGDSSPTPTPTPPAPINQPPAITSGTTVTTGEGQTAAFYNMVATDPEGATLSYAIAGGADAARFQLDARGALSFKTAPDFEAPTDADQNNVYVVQLVAGDGQLLSTALTLQVTVTDEPGGPLRARQIATGLSGPRELTSLPDGRLLVTQFNDQVRVVNPDTGAISATPFIDVAPEGQQLISVILSPNFAVDRAVYVSVRKNEPLPSSRSIMELRRYNTLPGDVGKIDQTSYQIILATPTRRIESFLGTLGQLAFGPDGLLYANFPLKDDTRVETAIQRIDLSGDDFPDDTLRNFRIPAGNPARCRPELWAFGFNLFDSLAVDRTTGFLWTLSNQGVNFEINLVRPSEAGSNYGEVGNVCGSMVEPVHTSYIVRGMSDQSANLVGGVVYRGPLESLQGRYIYGTAGIQVRRPIGDGPFKFPAVFTLSTVGAGSIPGFTPTTAVGVYLNRIAQDTAGHVYLLYSDGTIYVVEGA